MIEKNANSVTIINKTQLPLLIVLSDPQIFHCQLLTPDRALRAYPKKKTFFASVKASNIKDPQILKSSSIKDKQVQGIFDLSLKFMHIQITEKIWNTMTAYAKIAHMSIEQTQFPSQENLMIKIIGGTNIIGIIQNQGQFYEGSTLLFSEKHSLKYAPLGERWTIALKSLCNNMFVTSDCQGKHPLMATSAEINLAQRFEMIKVRQTKIAFRSFVTNCYVSADDHGRQPLIANKPEIGQCQVFDWLQKDGRYALMAMANLKFVSVQEAGALPLKSKTFKLGQWQWFQIIYLDDC